MALGYPPGEFGAVSDAATRQVAGASTRRGVASPRVNLPSFGKKLAQRKTEKTCQFATWNVRSLVNTHGPVETASLRGSPSLEDRRIDVVVHELERCHIEVAGLQETRWFGNESYRVGDSTVLSSGRPLPQDGAPFLRGEGVAIVLRGRALKAWKAGGAQWRAVSPRIAVAQLKMSSRHRKPFSLYVVVCYAPTFRSSRLTKDEFFDDLQEVLRGVNARATDKYVLLGDFNARVGSRTQTMDEWRDVRGPAGFGECNDAGKDLLFFCSMNNATICNTWFEKKAMHKQSWQHPRTKRWHAIDFIVVHQRDRRLCQDCRVITSAYCGSDHRMVCLTFILDHARFHHCPPAPKRTRFDVSLLRPTPGMSEEQRAEVHQRLHLFQASVSSALEEDESSSENDPSVEDQWQKVSASLVNAGTERLGLSRRRQPDWFTQYQGVIAPLLDERRLAFGRWTASQLNEDLTKYKVARSKARAGIRRVKNKWLEDMAHRADTGRASCHGGSVWSAIRAIQGCFQGLRPMPTLSIKDEEGLLCDSPEKLRGRWHRHFKRVLNVESEFDPSIFDTLQARPVREELAEVPSDEEVHRAISCLSNNKAPGTSGILAEMVKNGGPAFHTSLMKLISKIWTEGFVPQAWRDAEIVPIPKKGDLSLCDNWRGIALLDVIGKVVGRVIQTRLQTLAELELSDSQCGFRSGRSCTDQIFSVSQLIEKFNEHQETGFLTFIDLRKAYDSVSRPALWRALEVLGVPPQLVRLIASFHDNMSAKVRVNDGHTAQIPVNNGLRQGCSMAPVLFNLFFALVFEKWREEMADQCPDHGVSLRFKVGDLFNRPRTQHQQFSASDLEFADDAVIVTLTHSTAQTALSVFVSVATSFGLSVNFVKTKFMAVGVDLTDGDFQPLTIKNSTVDHVTSFPYLGSLLSPDARCVSEIDRRLAGAARIFGALECIFKSKNFTVRTKRLVYSSCVLSTLLYGSDCWAVLKRDERRLDVFHHRCLRAMLGVSRLEQQQSHISNADLRQRWGDPGLVSDILRKRRLQWLGHVARMSEDRMPKRLLFGWLPKTRPPHGPRLRWKDRVQADLKTLDVRDWFNVAQDRQEWRAVCRSLPAAPQPVTDSPVCEICRRTFKSRSGFKRHKCTAARQLPVSEQPGARQCLECDRWFRSAGGLAVHKCILQRATAATSETRIPNIDKECCAFHCPQCHRCFKSAAGFKRHNCHRGHQSVDRASFEHVCEACEQRFRRASDLTRHKCRLK